MNATRTPVVTVVGGGACGIATCAALVREAAATGRTRLELHLVEKQQRLGDGIAYASPYDWHLLNMQAATMSICPNAPDDFVTWLQGSDHAPTARAGGPATNNSTPHQAAYAAAPYDARASAVPSTTRTADDPTLHHAYFPRHRFAAYLRHRFSETVRAAGQAGVRLEVHQAEVLDCHPWGQRLTLECDRALQLPSADRAVLCLGDLPGPTHREFVGHPRYHQDPWRLDDSIPHAATVGILGTSLSAVDALAHLHATGHTSPIHCFSRTRPFPMVQPPDIHPYTLRHLTEERIAHLTASHLRLTLVQVADLIIEEIRDATRGQIGAARLVSRARRHDDLATDIEEAQSHSTNWYEALDATSPLAPSLWRALHPRAKTEFLAHHQGLWATWRHPMPLPNARRLHNLIKTGQLHWHPGIKTVRATRNGGFEVRCRHEGRYSQWHVDHLVNAIGTGFQPWLAAHPLLGALLDRGVLTAHPHGGVDVDFDTLQAHTAGGQPDTHIYFVGPLTRGVHFYTNAVETNLANITRMATHLIRSLPPSE
ncbi:FAD/NAD(P)-binding protein [Streptomyces sp. RGM 3693]|uniref:FAD/NAD(P)-binding protein n=1 Tax=Streptomyces sp. RGM 3693 TaxID=3413284 RepID=UPI003D288B3D